MTLLQPATDCKVSEAIVNHFSDCLSVHGMESCERHFDRNDLLEMARTNARPVSINSFSGRHIPDVRRVRGVRLTEILDAVGTQTLPRSKCNHLIIAAHANNGCVCLFTWHELYNTPTGQGAMVLVEPLDGTRNSRLNLLRDKAASRRRQWHGIGQDTDVCRSRGGHTGSPPRSLRTRTELHAPRSQDRASFADYTGEQPYRIR